MSQLRTDIMPSDQEQLDQLEAKVKKLDRRIKAEKGKLEDQQVELAARGMAEEVRKQLQPPKRVPGEFGDFGGSYR